MVAVTVCHPHSISSATGNSAALMIFWSKSEHRTLASGGLDMISPPYVCVASLDLSEIAEARYTYFSLPASPSHSTPAWFLKNSLLS